jgi:hypothetical protein
MMQDERQARRPTFLGGKPIRLADGRTWQFPGPEAGHREAFGSSYGPLIAALCQAEDEPERLRAEMALAICLLTTNYDLGPDDLCSVLELPPGDPGLAEMQRGFRELAADHALAARAAAQAKSESAPSPSHARPSSLPTRGMWASWTLARSRRV